MREISDQEIDIVSGGLRDTIPPMPPPIRIKPPIRSPGKPDVPPPHVGLPRPLPSRPSDPLI